ncbi:uncharacterized protein SETTUDRAFT_28931, partial [Exserohilum turcica Et28A]
MDLGSQDFRNRIVWPAKYPATYDPAPPILVQLKQPSVDTEVEKDIKRRNALWEKDDYQRRNSPTTACIQRIRGLLRLPRARPLPPTPNPTPKPIRPASPSPPSARISLISANAFHYTMKRKENEFFTTSIYEIDRILEERQMKDDPDNAKLVQDRLPSVYHAYRDVFSRTAADQLPEHRPYDHKIVLTEPLPNQFSP